MGVVITNMLTMMKLMMTMMMMESQDISQGVDQAKNCTQIWLPRAAYDCHEYLELMETGDHDSSEEVLACFTNIRYSLAAEECMEDRDYTQVEEDEVETLTEGILCIQESQTNLTNTIRYIFTNEIEEGFEDVHQFAEDDEVDDVTELEKVEDEMISLVYHRHCNIASDNDDDEEHCNLCFYDAAHNTDLVTPQDRVRALAYCSTTYLSPTYEECSLLLEDLSNNDDHDGRIGREIFRCFTRVVDRHNVEICSVGITPEMISAWSLLDVLACSQQVNDEWVSGRLHEEPEEYDYSDLLESTTSTEPLLDIF